MSCYCHTLSLILTCCVAMAAHLPTSLWSMCCDGCTSSASLWSAVLLWWHIFSLNLLCCHGVMQWRDYFSPYLIYCVAKVAHFQPQSNQIWCHDVTLLASFQFAVLLWWHTFSLNLTWCLAIVAFIFSLTLICVVMVVYFQFHSNLQYCYGSLRVTLICDVAMVAHLQPHFNNLCCCGGTSLASLSS